MAIGKLRDYLVVWILLITIAVVLGLGLSSALAGHGDHNVGYKCKTGEMPTALALQFMEQVNHNPAIKLDVAQKLNFLMMVKEEVGAGYIPERVEIWFVILHGSGGKGVHVELFLDGCQEMYGNTSTIEFEKIIGFVPA